MVTLEFSRYGLNFRRARAGALRQKAGEAIDELRAEGCRIDEAALDALFSYIDLPLEFTAASEYCDRRGAHLFSRRYGPFLLGKSQPDGRADRKGKPADAP